MTSAEKDKQEAREELRARLKPGMEILCVLRHVSRSGMQRVIDLKVIEPDAYNPKGTIKGIGYAACRAMGNIYRYDTKREGIVINGCGMDMGFALVYDLGKALWPDGTPEPHSTRNGSPDRDGGYALRSRWI